MVRMHLSVQFYRGSCPHSLSLQLLHIHLRSCFTQYLIPLLFKKESRMIFRSREFSIRLLFLLRLVHLLEILGNPEIFIVRSVFFLLRNVSVVRFFGLLFF